MSALANLQIELGAPSSERVVDAHELPLSVGGDLAAIALPDLDRSAIVAAVGADDLGLFVEPVGEPSTDRSRAVRLNGLPLTERSRLAHGDVLGAGDGLIFFLLEGSRPRLQIERAQQQLTTPPVMEEDQDQTAAAEGADTEAIHRATFRPLSVVTTGRADRRRPWQWAVAAAVFLLIAVLWVLMSSIPVQVMTQPSDADIDVTGGFAVGIGGSYLLRPGVYSLAVAREGYQPARQRLQVTDAPNQLVRITLKKLPGRLRIQTNGVTGTLSIDGTTVGAVPGEYSVAAGEHDLTIKATRYLDLVQPIRVEGGGKTQQVMVQLVPAFSPVTIESKPAGAKVSIDGKEVGATPVTAQVDAGAHTLRLQHPGFRTWESAIRVKANEPQTIGPVELGLPNGKLLVTTDPAGADVTVSGRYRGRAPVEVSLAPGMQHIVEINRAGYQPASRSVPIVAGKSSAVQIDLQPILGEVTVRGEPADAQLIIDGVPKGAATQTLQLPSTQLKVEIKREGYVTYTTTVTPQPEVPRLVEYRLLTPDQAQAARMPPVIHTKIGGQLRLMPTGSYQMGSSRREAGSRANESARAAILRRPFYLGIKEVTNAEYLRFQPDHLSGVVKNRSLDQDNHPVVNVSWREAVEFCNWLSLQEGLPPAYEQKGDHLVLASPTPTGYRLPTEAEWEWGARHQPGSKVLRTYQWGQTLPVPRNSGNYADKSSLLVLESGLQGYEDGFVTTAPVGSFRANPLGLFDMDGNVSEWVNDYYTIYRELDKGSEIDPTGPASGDSHVIRGANWRTTDFTDLRLAWREAFDGQAQHIGFRIARYAE